MGDCFFFKLYGVYASARWFSGCFCRDTGLVLDREKETTPRMKTMLISFPEHGDELVVAAHSELHGKLDWDFGLAQDAEFKCS